jgi:hypothetical protein
MEATIIGITLIEYIYLYWYLAFVTHIHDLIRSELLFVLKKMRTSASNFI